MCLTRAILIIIYIKRHFFPIDCTPHLSFWHSPNLFLLRVDQSKGLFPQPLPSLSYVCMWLFVPKKKKIRSILILVFLLLFVLYYYIYHQLTSTVSAFLNFGVNMLSQCFCWSFPTCSYSSIHHHNLNLSTNKKQQPFLLFLRLTQPKPKSSPFKLACLGTGAGTGTELFDQISQLAHNKVQNCCYPIYSLPFNLLSHYLNSYSFTGFSCSWYFCCNWTAL